MRTRPLLRPIFRPRQLTSLLPTMLCALLCALPPTLATSAPMKLADYMALSGPAPAARIAYGPAPSGTNSSANCEGAGP